jgi:hypothetical protein
VGNADESGAAGLPVDGADAGDAAGGGVDVREGVGKDAVDSSGETAGTGAD